jgi:hypothetical protein
MNKQAIFSGTDLGRTQKLSTKLLNEILAYERQLSELKTNGTYVNFTMIQTYKELIAARKDMLKRLATQF